MKFLIDECFTHRFIQAFAARGYPDAVHPIHIGLRSFRDDQIVARALTDDRIIVTANGRDYRRLLSRLELHPGALIAEALDNQQTWALILAAIAFIEAQPQPKDYMVNRIVEVSAAGGVRPYLLPVAPA